METTPKFEYLLECLVQLIGRAAVPPERVREVVGWNSEQVAAFNLCDGNTTLRDIAKGAELDQGNFSRTAKRWVQSGVAFRVGEGKNAPLLHIYPLDQSERPPKKSKKKQRPG